MADVDAIWAELQQEQSRCVPSQAKKAPMGGQSADLSSLQFERRKPKARPRQLDASLQWMKGWSASLKPSANVGYAAELAVGYAAAEPLVEPPSTLMDALGDIPCETPETFLAYLQRDINCLAEDSATVRLQSLQKLERVLVKQADTLPTDIIDAAADALLKPLLKRMKDKSEKCRLCGVTILTSLVETTSDLSSMLPYVFPTLVARLGCEDIDGVAHLPEAMRPDPEQKPTEITRPVEESEEVRLLLARLVQAVVGRCNQGQIYSWIDEATGLLRAQAMDPFHEVKVVAMESLTAFCYNHHEILLHFTEPLGRCLTSCLTHNHGKLRIAALRTLTAVLHCGAFKHNHEVIQMLMAWQDPNKCPVAAFYESVTSVNYMANLSFDRHPAVRRFWFETLGYWLLRLPDKCDHEPYIFPYLLTGLCDENEDIALECFWLIERCGELYEAEHEEDLRKTRQYGFDFGWTYSGRAFVPFPLQGAWAGGGRTGSVRRQAAQGPDMMGETDLGGHFKRDTDQDVEIDYGEEVEIPARDYSWPELRNMPVYRNLPRPRLGARTWVRTNTRRYIKATFNDVTDFRDCTALNAGRLLCMSIAYTEEGITEWLQPMIAAIIKFFAGRAAASGDSQCMQTYATVCKQLGSYCEPCSYWTQLKDALDGDSSLHLDQRVASVRVLALCLEGSVETLATIEDRDAVGMGRLDKVIPELISAMHASDLLLWPSEASRRVMWELLFSFLGPLRQYLSFSEVSQLLYVALSLAAKAPSEAAAEGRASQGDVVEAPRFEEEELVDSDKLSQALELLSKGIGEKAAPLLSLDDLDDGPAEQAEVSPSMDPRVVHQELFRRAFTEVLARLDDSFQVFRSVVYLSPLAVLASSEHSGAVLQRLAVFCGPSSSPQTRREGHVLGVHVAIRCARFTGAGGTEETVRAFARRTFQSLGKAHIDAMTTATLSYAVVVSGLSLWRRYFLSPEADPRAMLFPPEGETSRPLQWLTILITDQELYKRFHAAANLAEKAATGKGKDDFVLKTTKHIREAAERRAAVARALAASTLLIGLRRSLADGRGPLPWAEGRGAGSARALFLGAASLFRTPQPSIEPLFVRPTQPPMVMYAAELLRLLLNQEPGAVASPSRLQDDAARAIHTLELPTVAPQLPLSLQPEEREQLATEFLTVLVDLNLSLPPDPNAKHAPITLGEGSSGEIILGWDASLSPSAEAAEELNPPRSSRPAAASVADESEVARLLAQSDECLRWNAALALYKLGVDLSVVCQDGFLRSLDKWRKRKEQAKVLLAVDLLSRAGKVDKRTSAPRALAPS